MEYKMQGWLKMKREEVENCSFKHHSRLTVICQNVIYYTVKLHCPQLTFVICFFSSFFFSLFFLLEIPGEAQAISKTEQRGGGDKEAAGKTEGD